MKKSIKSLYSFLRGIIPEKYQGEARFICKINFVSIPISWYAIIEKSGGFHAFMADNAKENYIPLMVFLFASPAIYCGFLSIGFIGFESLNWFLKQTKEDYEDFVFLMILEIISWGYALPLESTSHLLSTIYYLLVSCCLDYSWQERF